MSPTIFSRSWRWAKLFIFSVIVSIISSLFLLKIFAIFLIFFSISSFLNSNFKIPKTLSTALLFLSGIIQGIFGTGGPFIVMGYQHAFANKSELRSTLAGFFITANIIRLIQFQWMGSVENQSLVMYWWIFIPIGTSVYLGYFFHKKISDKLFRSGILSLILIAGIVYLFK